MDHGIVDVFAYQEALLIEAAFGIALLIMAWVGFRRWLEHKGRSSERLGDHMAERVAQFGRQMDQVDARLNAIEQGIRRNEGQAVAQLEAEGSTSLPDPTLARGDV
ncbi:MAG TPA: hypothetical protein VE989_00055 [Sphingomicrobium sp.]|nr:hypothetical protein [Sphingomicrobium sp.]